MCSFGTRKQKTLGSERVDMSIQTFRLILLQRQFARTLVHTSRRHISTTWTLHYDDKNVARGLIKDYQSELSTKDFFSQIENKNKENFKNALDLYKRGGTKRRGSMEFIKAALTQMKAYGVHRDLDTYRALLDVMPKGKYIARNRIQAEYSHYPKQQDCGLDVLIQMGRNQVQPDVEFCDLVLNVFGKNSKPYRLVSRMMFWMPKLKNLSPYPLPFDLPKDSLELAKLAIKQITTPDIHTEVKVYQAEDLSDSIDKTWIVSGQSPLQRDMIKKLPKTKALYVEGAFRVWLRDVQVNYFILRGDPIPRPPPPEGDVDDVSQMKNWYYGECKPSDLVRLPNIHEQEDATLLGCCATGSSSKDSLLSWIRFLQQENPDLQDIPILFTLSSPLGPVIPIDVDQKGVRKS